MKINIKRIDNTLPLPEYQTAGSVAFDLIAREDVLIKPFEVKLIPCNIIVKVPKGYMLMLASRSSTPLKKGLLIANGIGVIDQDYHGPEDEIKFQVLNFTKEDVLVKRGERLVQATFVPVQKVTFKEISKISNKSRGGFGSTG